MLTFVNNWLREISLPQGATACPLDLPDGEYRLTLADAASGATRWEIADAVVLGGAATLVRAREGTADQEWPAGSVIYCDVTAETLASMASGGGGTDDTLVEMITEEAHTSFFGAPASAPARVGQRCLQMIDNGSACEWVAHTDWEQVLRWARLVLPLRDWGVLVPDIHTHTIGVQDRAYAATTDRGAENPRTITVNLPALIEGVYEDGFAHGPLPLVFTNWSQQTWSIRLDPSAFWVSGLLFDLFLEGFAQLGLTVNQEGADDRVTVITLPPATNVWIDAGGWAYPPGGGDYESFGMNLTARPLNLYL